MFGKFSKKTIVNMKREGKGYNSSGTTSKLNDGELLNYLKNNLDKYGSLVITGIQDDKIFITTKETLEFRKNEHKLDEIKDLISDYINNN